MGEGLMKKMFQEIYSPSRAEDAEDLGEYSDSGGGDSDAPTPRNNLPMTPSSKSPLYDFSYLFEQIPIRKGLSQYYQGKSQSFTSLLEVKSLEELPKKEIRCSTRKMKPCKSYAALDKAQELSISSESCSKSIPKKIPPSMATSCASSMSRTGSGSFLSRGGRPPPIQVHKHHQ